MDGGRNGSVVLLLLTAETARRCVVVVSPASGLRHVLVPSECAIRVCHQSVADEWLAARFPVIRVSRTSVATFGGTSRRL